MFFKIKEKEKLKTGFGGLLPDQEKCPSTALIRRSKQKGRVREK